MKSPLWVVLSLLVHKILSLNYCGINYVDSVVTCRTQCPNNTDDECPSGEQCFSDVICCIPDSNNYCGITYEAAFDFHKACPCNLSEECGPNEECYSHIFHPNATSLIVAPTLLPTNKPVITTPAVASIPLSTSDSNIAIIASSVVVGCLCLLIILVVILWKRIRGKLRHSHEGDTTSRFSYRYEFSRLLYDSILSPRSVSNSSGNNQSVKRSIFGSSYAGSSAKVTIRLNVSENDDSTSGTVNWNDIYFTSESSSNILLGQGSFGIVVRALWNTTENGKKVIHDVAVKVITKSCSISNESIYEDEQYRLAMEEVRIIQTARKRMVCVDHVICVYGIAVGALPTRISDKLHIPMTTSAIGIVMRYEGGGSLTSLLYHSQKANSVMSFLPNAHVTLLEKIRILKSVVRGLAELHSVGVIHGDIKPDNILLSGDTTPVVRLADFGISTMREKAESFETTMQSTIHTRGSPVYSAPEMLVNPYLGEIRDYKVALPSRRTDMYAFAVLACEVLTQSRPYAEMKLREMTLCMAVHQGVRPSLVGIPSECPESIVEMIKLCWDGDRMKRLTATQCYRILNEIYSTMTNGYYDVLLSHHPDDSIIVEALYSIFDSMGLKIAFSHQCTKNSDNHKSLRYTDSSGNTTENSNKDSTYISMTADFHYKVVIACISQKYQESSDCISHLQCAKSAHPVIPIIPLFIQSAHESWVTPEMRYYCQLKSLDTKYYTYIHVASESHYVDIPPSVSMDSTMGDQTRLISTTMSLDSPDMTASSANMDMDMDVDVRENKIEINEPLQQLCTLMYDHIMTLLQSSILTPRSSLVK